MLPASAILGKLRPLCLQGNEINKLFTLEEIKTDKEIERRKNISKEKFNSMAKILKSKRLKLATKLKIVKCYIYITYGCEAWTLYQNTFAQREIAELRCFLHKTEYCVKKIVRKTQGSAKKAINISKYP